MFFFTHAAMFKQAIHKARLNERSKDFPTKKATLMPRSRAFECQC